MSSTIEAHVEVAAPPERVLAALTEDRERRRWLGDAVPGPETAAADGTIAIAWPMAGRDTIVRIELAPTAAGTGVSVRHEGLAERRTGEASLRDFWHLALANLRGLVESGEVAPTTELAPSRGDVRLEVEAAAPGASVFRALVEPSELERWIAERAEVEPEVGGRYDFGWGAARYGSSSWSRIGGSPTRGGTRTTPAGPSRRRPSSSGRSRNPTVGRASCSRTAASRRRRGRTTTRRAGSRTSRA
jgi:uncharacterized protein YndB with AHSA1/START domain